jgi:ketosteroid isomerase-like protein
MKLGIGVMTHSHDGAIQRADSAFFEALVDRDIPALETLLATEFLIVDVASGTVQSRAAFLDAISRWAVTFLQIKTFPEETTIRLAGPGAGIVVGRTAMSLSDAGGAVTEIASRYTHVFEGDRRSWRLVSAQGTLIPGPSFAR